MVPKRAPPYPPSNLEKGRMKKEIAMQTNRIMDEFASHGYGCYRSRQLEEPSGESRLKRMEFLGATGQTSPWDHPAQAGFSNPANGILTPESDNSLTIIFQKNCQ